MRSVVQALRDVGYEAPTPIQAATIRRSLPAPTSWGSADGYRQDWRLRAPISVEIDVTSLRLRPWCSSRRGNWPFRLQRRFSVTATHNMKGFHVLPIYGGQSYPPSSRSEARVRTNRGTPAA